MFGKARGGCLDRDIVTLAVQKDADIREPTACEQSQCFAESIRHASWVMCI
jgi:hypothetical protein